MFVTILYLTFLLIFVLFLLPIGFCRWPSTSDSGPLASLAICWNRPMSRLSGHYGTSHLPTRTNIKMASNTNMFAHNLIFIRIFWGCQQPEMSRGLQLFKMWFRNAEFALHQKPRELIKVAKSLSCEIQSIFFFSWDWFKLPPPARYSWHHLGG